MKGKLPLWEEVDNSLRRKIKFLGDYLKSLGPLCVSISGGIDSGFLLFMAKMVTDDVIAVHISSPFHRGKDAENVASWVGVDFFPVYIDLLSFKDIRENGRFRCYYCKREMYRKIKEVAGDRVVLDGSNMDDLDDFRPGMRALSELGIKSPLIDMGFYKKEIREAARFFNIPFWDKPSDSCLATRIPHGFEIKEEILKRVYNAESFLLSLGFKTVRVRDYGNLAKIEVGRDELEKAFAMRDFIADTFKTMGYESVSLDLKGYRGRSVDD